MTVPIEPNPAGTPIEAPAAMAPREVPITPPSYPLIHLPDWQVRAARETLARARWMILAGEKMSDEAAAQIDAALSYLWQGRPPR